MAIFLLVLALILVIGLILVHEFGHFIVARRGGVEAEEFGLFFPPRIWGKKIRKNKGDNTLYSINLLPLGGFVKLKGEHDSDTEKGSFGAASLKRKTMIMLAGVGMNFLAAAVILTFLAAIGMPHMAEGQFTVKSDTKISTNKVVAVQVEPNSPASVAGISDNDQIKSVAGVEVTSESQLHDLTSNNAGKSVEIIYEHNGVMQTKEVKLAAKDSKTGQLGIAPLAITLHRSTWSAPVVGVVTTLQFSWLTLHSVGSALASVFTGNGAQAAAQVSGPVGIYSLLSQVSHIGISFVLFVVAVISVALAVMNLLPIPALDGGRLYIILFYRARKKVLTAEMEERINATGMAVLLALILLVTIIDIRRL